GNRIRSATRADCTRCPGSSNGTVAYTDEVAYCHRCQWRANRTTLERELGLRPALRGCGRRPTPAEQAAAERRRQIEAEIAALEAWLHWRAAEMGREECWLREFQQRIAAVLAAHPEREYTWAALAYVIQRLRELDAEWEFLFCDPLPQYRDDRTTMAELYTAFLNCQRRRK
ncbi:MAG: hypothetical protein ACRD5F_03590, partial [Candidatus Acidiferrales bacterium]